MFKPRRLLKLLKNFGQCCDSKQSFLLDKKLGESTSSKRLGQEVRDSLQAKESQCMTKLATGTFTGLFIRYI